MVNGVQYQCLNPLDYGVEPDPNELSHIELGYGLLSYSSMGLALLSTAKQIFMTGSSRLTALYKQAMSKVFVELYFYSFVFMM